jgi:hypothetical protein
MIKAAGYTTPIIKGDTIAARVHERAIACDKDLINLLDRTCLTVALSFDGWTSLNNFSMLAVNGTWAGLDMKIYKACFDFIEIKGSHSSQNLAHLVFKRAKKLGILYKIIIITRDNASNNDTCACYLYKMMSCIYDNHLDKLGLCGQSMTGYFL